MSQDGENSEDQINSYANDLLKESHYLKTDDDIFSKCFEHIDESTEKINLLDKLRNNVIISGYMEDNLKKISLLSKNSDKNERISQLNELNDIIKPNLDEKKIDILNRKIQEINNKDNLNYFLENIKFSFNHKEINDCFINIEKILYKLKLDLQKINEFLDKMSFIRPSKNDSKIEKEKKKNIINSIEEIILTFPNIELDKYDKIDFNDLTYAATNFYLKTASITQKEEDLDIINTNKSINLISEESNERIKELTLKELLDSLKSFNSEEYNFSKDELDKLEKYIEICNNKKNDKDIRKKNGFKKWLDEEFPKYDFDSEEIKFENIAKTLGVISYGLYDSSQNENEKFQLRNTQILAILLFIRNYEKKDQSKGLIEEISTGEGKSAIITCLAAFFALRKHKVDIITSSRNLAERDSIKFKKFYEKFNLSNDICSYFNNSDNDASYKADIIYGTFLDFEGDILDKISRGDINPKNIYERPFQRPYDIIIIDEVDNMFIDCINGRTQLTRSSKGFQYITPLYFSIYLFIENLDNIFFETFIKELKKKNINIDRRDILSHKLYNDKKIKKNLFKIIKVYFEDFLDKLNNSKIEQNLINVYNNENSDSAWEKSLIFPHFLNEFVLSQLDLWIENAYMAKISYEKEVHYTLSNKRYGYDNITPIDRKNTGELELNTIYSDGLHQMLQVKEKIEVHPERLTHTFLSHITYFQKFKKKNFFGLTGTIGGKESKIIWENDYFCSHLLKIPQFRKKRFIELPPIIVERNNHLSKICEDIIYNFNKGRKILVICKNIKEGLNIKNLLQKDISTENIFEYLKNDEDNIFDKLNKSNARIIISTNLGGRGTDIYISPEIEKNGGLHVILTKLSDNSRTQRQAFGRTSRQGKKGTGQLIIKKEKDKILTYSEIIKKRDEKEEKKIKEIDLNKILLKDQLFERYTKYISDKKINNFKYLKSDIDEKWSLFLKQNIKNNKEEIYQNFEKFLRDIDNVMKLPSHEQFNNKFLRIAEGIEKFPDFNPKLEDYLNFKDNSQCFYFAVPYFQAIISHFNYLDNLKNTKTSIKDNTNCKLIIENLKKTKVKLENLIEINIEPCFKNFNNWEKNNVDKIFSINFNKKYINTSLYNQIQSRKKILKAFINHIDDSISTIDKYIEVYLPKISRFKLYLLYKEETPLSKLFYLTEEIDQRNLEYLYDAGLSYGFKFKIKESKVIFTEKAWKYTILFFLLLMINMIPFIGFIIPILEWKYGIIENNINNIIKNLDIKFIDIEEDNSGFNSFFTKIKKIFKKNEAKENDSGGGSYGGNGGNSKVDPKEKEHAKDKKIKSLNSYSLKEYKNLKKDIIENIEKFTYILFEEKRKGILNQMKFILLIDEFYENSLWKAKIIEIIENNFTNYEMLKKKRDLIKILNDRTKFNEGINYLKEFVKKCIDIIFESIKKCLNDNKYNENKLICCLEHLLIKENFGDINEKESNLIVQQILSQGIIQKDRKFNKSLFKNNKNYIQTIDIYYRTPFPKIINKIQNIDDFYLENFHLSFENDYILEDIKNIYETKNYKEKPKLIFNIFKNKVKEFLKKLFEMTCNDNINEVDRLFLDMKSKIKDIIKNYFKEEIFPNIKIFEIENDNYELNNQEKEIYNKVCEISHNKVLDILKSHIEH